jgi:hypothetical protein
MKDLQAKRTTYQPATNESYTEPSSLHKILVQVLRGMLCFRGVSWLLLCTSKEVTRCPKDSGSFALASKEVTRSASGRAEALALKVIKTQRGRAEARFWSAGFGTFSRQREKGRLLRFDANQVRQSTRFIRICCTRNSGTSRSRPSG